MNELLFVKKQSDRKQWMDYARGIGIILVMIGHLPNLNYHITRYIFSFHMPLFFVISGYVSNNFREKREINKLMFSFGKYYIIMQTFYYLIFPESLDIKHIFIPFIYGGGHRIE